MPAPTRPNPGALSYPARSIDALTEDHGQRVSGLWVDVGSRRRDRSPRRGSRAGEDTAGTKRRQGARESRENREEKSAALEALRRKEKIGMGKDWESEKIRSSVG